MQFSLVFVQDASKILLQNTQNYVTIIFTQDKSR